MGIDWKKFFLALVVLYFIIFVAFKSFCMAFFPDFYFGPFQALSLLLMFTLIAGYIEAYKGPPEDKDDQILANAALMLIASIVSNGNKLEVPSYIVAATAQKLNDKKVKMEIEEVDGKYIMKVDVK